jgi:hypothetical protein
MTPDDFRQSVDVVQPVDGPIFITADEPLLIFESIERAVGYLEWQDVEDGIYVGYDRTGRRIDFTTAGTYEVGYRVDETESNQTEFEATLRRILDRWVPREIAPSATLAELEALAIGHFGLTG